MTDKVVSTESLQKVNDIFGGVTFDEFKGSEKWAECNRNGHLKIVPGVVVPAPTNGRVNSSEAKNVLFCRCGMTYRSIAS